MPGAAAGARPRRRSNIARGTRNSARGHQNRPPSSASSHSHLISSHLIASHRISSHLISSHLIASHRIASHLISSYLISSIDPVPTLSHTLRATFQHITPVFLRRTLLTTCCAHQITSQPSLPHSEISTHQSVELELSVFVS